ncbi:MAG: rRNA adenine N-6-methyltransferase family protein, partial [Sphaerochaetaceae bacterium]|nr:rRNA adenine N-6-methyltransferase family protein [Sphaerochaetaceae bacterium]
MSKKFGQNFLISSSARKRIADSVISKQGVRVWEVGPGIGALTVQLL